MKKKIDKETASKILAKKLFPNEIWENKGGVRLAQTRLIESRNGNEPDKLKKEIRLSLVLNGLGYSVWLIPEKINMKVGGKRPDAIINGRLAELKFVTGKIGKIWTRLTVACLQTNDSVYVGTDKNYTTSMVIQMIRGKFIKALRDNKDYSYPFPFDMFYFVSSDNEIHEIHIRKIWESLKN